MKKLNTRTLLLTLLVIASIASYVYLNTVTTAQGPANAQKLELRQEFPKMDGREFETEEVSIPAVTVLKKLFRMGRYFAPAS